MLTKPLCRTGCRGKVRRPGEDRRFARSATPPIRGTCILFPGPPYQRRFEQAGTSRDTLTANESDRRPRQRAWAFMKSLYFSPPPRLVFKWRLDHIAGARTQLAAAPQSMIRGTGFPKRIML